MSFTSWDFSGWFWLTQKILRIMFNYPLVTGISVLKSRNEKNEIHLTLACSAIACESCPTCAIIWAHGVKAKRVSRAVMCSKGAFINI